MCGIGGFISDNNQPVSLGQLRTIARSTVTRGAHAWGMAWVDSRNRLHSFKAEGPVTADLSLLDMASDARLLVMHCRYATRGAASDQINNHPHPVDGGWLVHNGTIRNQVDLSDYYGLWPTGECDSEALGLLINSMDADRLLDRCSDAVELCDGPLAMISIWTRPRRVVVARRGKPLHMAKTPQGSIYFASLADAFGAPIKVPDNTVSAISFTAGRAKATSVRIEPQAMTIRERAMNY